MSKPTICFVALILTLVNFGLVIAAFSMAFVALEAVHNG